jgi:hypothetical protein
MEWALPRARTRRRRRPPLLLIVAILALMLVVLIGIRGVAEGSVSGGIMGAVGLSTVLGLWPLLFDDPPRVGWLRVGAVLWWAFWPVWIYEVARDLLGG